MICNIYCECSQKNYSLFLSTLSFIYYILSFINEQHHMDTFLKGLAEKFRAVSKAR